MKNKLLAGAMALALIGCSEQSADAPAQDASKVAEAAIEESAADAATPDIPTNATPGVAFDYRYGFELEDGQISKVQQAHAEACEKLGLARCRIVDIRYTLNDDQRVEAQTQFKLDPGLARRFGADVIAMVEEADGKLTGATIAGEDVGTQILASQQRSAGSMAEIERLEDRLKQGGLAPKERAEIQRQIAGLRGELDGEVQTRRSGEARIALTSLVVDYRGSGGVPGFGHNNPFSAAGKTFLQSSGTALSLILTIGAAVLPWAALLGLLVLIWRSNAVRALRGRRSQTATTAATSDNS